MLFLQGGAFLQFGMIAMNFLRNSGKPADYLVTGTWSKKALDEAKTQGAARAVFDGKATNYNRVPNPGEYKIDPNAAYAYMASNETIQGVQFASEPDVGDVPLVCDTSSDFLCRPVPVSKYALLYACAQKNAGPAGVTMVIIRDDLAERSATDLPTIFNYKLLAENKSMLNTPPTFAIYMVKLVTDWLLRDIGGLDKMLEINRKKSSLLYDAVDASNGFYVPHAEKNSRSLMNVPFKLANPALEDQFLKGAAAVDLVELKGHRSVGGFRASIYNAMPLAGVEALRAYMLDFAKKNG